MGSAKTAEEMEKYGVVVQDDNTKTASTVAVCPKCGKPIDVATPNYCKDCGTLPWEKKP